jgi:hypothetical protein
VLLGAEGGAATYEAAAAAASAAADAQSTADDKLATVSVDGTTITGNGTPSSPLKATDSIIPDAPADGKTYGRKDSAWVEIPLDPALLLLTPAMTSNTTPAPFVVSASSFSSGTLARAYEVFMQDTGRPSGQLWISADNTFDENGNGNQWVQILFGTARIIKKVKIYAPTNTPHYINESPRDFNIQISQDGANWTTALAVADAPGPSAAGALIGEYALSHQSVGLRINVTKIQSKGTYGAAAIRDIFIHGN